MRKVQLLLQIVRTHRQGRRGLLVRRDHPVPLGLKDRRGSRATRDHKALRVFRDQRVKPGSVGLPGQLALQDLPAQQARLAPLVRLALRALRAAQV